MFVDTTMSEDVQLEIQMSPASYATKLPSVQVVCFMVRRKLLWPPKWLAGGLAETAAKWAM